MATNYPLATAGAREPDQRPRPVPKIVKDACLLMIYGDLEDEDDVPIDLISAAKAVGMRPATLRRYLTRPQVIAFLRAERRAFRESICAGNEGALKRVRDGDQHANPMARVAAVRALEQLDADQARPGGPGHVQSLPGLVVMINVPVGADRNPVTITPLKPADIEAGTGYKIPHDH